jgi:hypothetical protein
MTSDDLSPGQKGWATRRARQAREQTLATCASLRGRFMEGGEALGDADLLTLIVGDKATATKLIAAFGSFAETIAAPADRLIKLSGSL